MLTCKCGYKTNTALSYQADYKDDKAEYCYARIGIGIGEIGGGKWVKGCGYDRAPQETKELVDSLVSKKSY